MRVPGRMSRVFTQCSVAVRSMSGPCLVSATIKGKSVVCISWCVCCQVASARGLDFLGLTTALPG